MNGKGREKRYSILYCVGMVLLLLGRGSNLIWIVFNGLLLMGITKLSPR